MPSNAVAVSLDVEHVSVQLDFSDGTSVELSTVTPVEVVELDLGGRGPQGDPGPAGTDGTPIWLGTWLDDYTYQPGDAVTAGGSSWVCRATSLNNQPPNGAYWDVLALAAQATNWRFSNLSAYIGTTDPITLPVTSGQSVIQGSEFVFLDTGFLIRNEDYSTDGPTITPLYAYEGRRLYARYQETA